MQSVTNIKLEKNICGICLDELTPESVHQLKHCKCSFCKNCLDHYFQFMIDNGYLRIQCPSFRCFFKKPISFDEINQLISGEHQSKFRAMFNDSLNHDDSLNDLSNNNSNGGDFQTRRRRSFRCPYCSDESRPSLDQPDSSQTNDTLKVSSALIIKCSKCSKVSCLACRSKLSGTDTEHDCQDLNENVLDEFDIKRCPNCNFLIQREGGCAQISCRNCCHVFCWHCLKSLENDFLLFHYDSGPCKNKLGHSRFSIFINRAQTVSICVGISILMLLASPVIIVLLPCVMTKKCRICRRKRKDSMA